MAMRCHSLITLLYDVFLSHVDMIRGRPYWTLWTRHHTMPRKKKGAFVEEFIVLIVVCSSFVGNEGFL